MYMPVCVYWEMEGLFIYMCTVPVEANEGTGSPGPEIAGSWELPDLGTRNQCQPPPPRVV